MLEVTARVGAAVILTGLRADLIIAPLVDNTGFSCRISSMILA
jgi:hypothetical protein